MLERCKPDEPDGGGHFVITVEGLMKLVKWQQFNTVRNSCNSHKMANLVLQLGVQSIMKYPLAHHYRHVGNEVARPGVRLPCRLPSRPPPFLPLDISNEMNVLEKWLAVFRPGTSWQRHRKH